MCDIANYLRHNYLGLVTQLKQIQSQVKILWNMLIYICNLMFLNIKIRHLKLYITALIEKIFNILQMLLKKIVLKKLLCITKLLWSQVSMASMHVLEAIILPSPIQMFLSISKWPWFDRFVSSSQALPQAVDNHMHCFAIYYKFLWLLGALSQTPLWCPA